MYLYDSTLLKPTTEGWLGFEMSRTPPPLDQHLSMLEEALASLLGQARAYPIPNPRTRALALTLTLTLALRLAL